MNLTSFRLVILLASVFTEAEAADGAEKGPDFAKR